MHLAATLTVITFSVSGVFSRAGRTPCEVRARTTYGWVCGSKRIDDDGGTYASFRGVPYATQPLGELRFKELQPPTPWTEDFDATEDGPICPQHDLFYYGLMTNRVMSEACIHANIHVPITGLPDPNKVRVRRNAPPPHQFGTAIDGTRHTGLPIVVFIHGGGFGFGSGSADVYGPEYLVSQGVIVITFNYRLGAFGFLSLNTTNIPGNNGLRDAVTLLRWVQNNARAFGGDPDNVTLGGQSAGACMAHLLSLSEAAIGLFKRIWLMSGTATRSFFNTSPQYVQYLNNGFFSRIGINSTDPEDIYKQLINAPLEDIMNATCYLQDMNGINGLGPVVESSFPGVTRILDNDPEALLFKGRGNNISIVVGFTNKECESFRPRLQEINIGERIKQNPLIMVPQSLLFKISNEASFAVASEAAKLYNVTGPNMLDNYINYCTDVYLMYPSLKLAEWRSKQEAAAPIYLYEFAYEADYSVVKDILGLKYNGSAHLEDMTFIFKIQAGGKKQSYKDKCMRNWMTMFFTNYMKCSSPSCAVNGSVGWPPVPPTRVQYQLIDTPKLFKTSDLTDRQDEAVRFFDTVAFQESH